MTDKSVTLTVELPIRVRRTEGGGGRVTEERTVVCPSRGASVPVAKCAECAQVVDIAVDSSGPGRVQCVVGVETARVAEAAARRQYELDPTLLALLETTLVSEAMTAEVACVTPEVLVEDVAELLLTERISGVPVVDDAGHPIGIVTKTDLVREHFEPELSREDLEGGRPTVREVMTESAIRLPESASLAQAAAILAYEGVHRVPIVSDAGRVVGILSALDVVRWLASRAGYLVPRKR